MHTVLLINHPARKSNWAEVDQRVGTVYVSDKNKTRPCTYVGKHAVGGHVF